MPRVLIIEDQEDVRRFLARAVRSFGYEVRTAGDGNEAVTIGHTWRPDAILTDIFMPNKDGLETIRELRRSARGIPLLAMSGGGSTGDMDVLRTARLMGARRVLAKPFGIAQLKAAIEDVLPPPEESPKRCAESTSEGGASA